MNPLSIATRGKGVLGTLKRVNTIRKRYGFTASNMDRLLSQFAGILSQFNCGATFPITAAALMRKNGIAHKYQARNIEFAVHGYFHIDHTLLPPERQFTYMDEAQQVLKLHGVSCSGFRSPYLRWNEDTLSAARQVGFLYDSSQGLAWDIVDEVTTEAYDRVLDFYGAVSANRYPALPHLENGLVRFPYCLPDDEALIERFHLMAVEPMNQLWLAILAETYRLGELFTLGLHPERIDLCETALCTTLRKARELSPPVWIARLDEIARWWKARLETVVTIDQLEPGQFHICVNGPTGVSILTRGVELITPATNWDGVYRRTACAEVHLRADRRPLIGVSPSSAPYLLSFLRQQGYIVEFAEDVHTHTLYLDRPHFRYEDERSLLAQIEGGDFPLVRLGRWPDGTHSALCVTGDIDALTIWDYSLRFLGR